MGSFVAPYVDNMLTLEYGYPLYFPQLPSEYPVRIGDIGFIDDGAFCRVFNSTLESADGLNKHVSCGGPPANHVPLKVPPYLYYKRDNYIPKGVLFNESTKQCKLDFGADGTVETGVPGVSAGLGTSIRFSCSGETGAFLNLRDPAISHKAEKRSFKNYIIENLSVLEKHMKTLGFDKAHRNGLIIVTGTVKTTGWVMASLIGAQNRTREVAFTTRLSPIANVTASYTHSISTSDPTIQVRADLSSVVEEAGPGEGGVVIWSSDSPHEADQCIFLGFFKIRRRQPRILSLIRRIFKTGATSPQEMSGSSYGASGAVTPDGTVGDPKSSNALADTVPISNGALTDDGTQNSEMVPDHMNALIDYIFENSVSSEIALVHTDDLWPFIHYDRAESLPPAAEFPQYLRKISPKIIVRHGVGQIDIGALNEARTSPDKVKQRRSPKFHERGMVQRRKSSVVLPPEQVQYIP